MANTKNKAILDNANEKIKYFNRTGIHYEVIYHYVIRKRGKTEQIYDKDFLDDIVAGLISFDMQRMMGKDKYLAESKISWAAKLHAALKTHNSTLVQAVGRFATGGPCTFVLKHNCFLTEFLMAAL